MPIIDITSEKESHDHFKEVKVKKIVEHFKILNEYAVLHTEIKCEYCGMTQEILDNHMNNYCPNCGKPLWTEEEE